ncbi:MAG: transporter protein [Clostridiales bacterium]|jgi:ABC-type transport system involved in multi-copper enzyme maturation permease subunit|nr:transporter protein [Clostridiales bacterium]
MKGLILKDLYTLRKQVKMMILIIVFYSFYAVMMKSTSFLGAMVALLCAMQPISTLSYDEYCKWDRYALSMPVSRKNIVLGKYLLGVILCLGGLVIVTPISIVIAQYTGEMKIIESLIMILAYAGIAIVFLSVVLPIIFKFGVEKGRMLMMLTIFIPMMLGFFASKLGLQLPSAQTLRVLAYASPFAVIIIFLISIRISIGIFVKKEF